MELQRIFSSGSILLVTSVFMLILVSQVNEAKVFSKCSFVTEAKKHFPKEQIDKWTCIARYESNFDTEAMNTDNGDNSTDHGIFQINDRYWCSPGPANVCNVSCEALRSEDLTEAAACAQKILSIQGFTAWSVYPIYCNNSFSFSQDCSVSGSDLHSRRFSFSFAAPPSLFEPSSTTTTDRNSIATTRGIEPGVTLNITPPPEFRFSARATTTRRPLTTNAPTYRALSTKSGTTFPTLGFSIPSKVPITRVPLRSGTPTTILSRTFSSTPSTDQKFDQRPPLTTTTTIAPIQTKPDGKKATVSS